jgi:hypothetical protein
VTCSKCGAHDQNDHFCSKCGTPIDRSTTVCGSCNREVLNSNFCHLCGESIGPRTCLHCGSEGQTGKFCRACGTSRDEKPRKKKAQSIAEIGCPSCGDQRLSDAIKTDAWVTCLSCFEQFDRVVMVSGTCPSCGGIDTYRNRGDGGPFCISCIETKLA